MKITASEVEERFVAFECGGDRLAGVLAQPSRPLATGVLVVVGGPQYRVGSHRQFVLLARALAAAGIACLRFDYRGMGDSEGQPRSFEGVSEDIAAAIDRFMAEVPSLKRVVLWGLCDGASAAAIYAAGDARVAGQVLLNPWVRSEAGESRALMRGYYLERLASRAFWSKLAAGEFDAAASLRALAGHLRRALAGRGAGASAADGPAAGGDYLQRMGAGLAAFRGDVLIVTSGRDLVAAEFLQFVARSKPWARALRRPGVTWESLPEADHTFSSAGWRDRVAEITRRWVEEGDRRGGSPRPDR